MFKEIIYTHPNCGAILKDVLPYVVIPIGNPAYIGGQYYPINNYHMYDVHPYTINKADLNLHCSFFCSKSNSNNECKLCEEKMPINSRCFMGVIDKNASYFNVLDVDSNTFNSSIQPILNKNGYDILIQNNPFLPTQSQLIAATPSNSLTEAEENIISNLPIDWYKGYINNFAFFEDMIIDIGMEKIQYPNGTDGMKCNKCLNDFPYVNANQANGSYICSSCRIF